MATGEVLGRITRKHRSKEFLAFLAQIDRSVPAPLELHLILEHKTAISPYGQRRTPEYPQVTLDRVRELR